MKRYICIHGHFYQPPRENPWLEAIELQDSAAPYHDWNERITAECYAPNSAARILDSQGRIAQIVNNYARMSFNFGPTLLTWMQEKAPAVYGAILAADQESRQYFSGHGSALAQAYNHLILPLANSRDKYTQVFWGMRDFAHRFGRQPEGMWLPETAVDLETLDILAALGIRFTILAPHQASRVRERDGDAWRDVSGGRIDPSTAYELRLPSSRKINLFFYDGPISQAIAFNGLLHNGERLAQRLVNAFSAERAWPQLIHIATDGETYGHHHQYGDMALAYALRFIEASNTVHLTNYGEYLEQHPPTQQAEIFERTAWSCAHGVERWRGNCGCNTGGHSGWTQAWRTPLRRALDWLRDTLIPVYEERASQLLLDPWAARNDYIDVILDRSPERRAEFLGRHAASALNEAEQVTVFQLLELQRHAMLMYTSCGWFFDDLSGPETVQVLRHAGRVVQLAQQLFATDVEPYFLDLLALAKSNAPEEQNGRHIYASHVKPTVVDLAQVGAHYAMSTLFTEYAQHAQIYCYTADCAEHWRLDAAQAKLWLGWGKITSTVTHESAILSLGVLHLGGYHVNAFIREFQGEKAYQTMAREVTQAFTRMDFVETIRRLDKYFASSSYSLGSLFRDQQRKILDFLLEPTLAEAETMYRQLLERHAPLRHFLAPLGVPLPKALALAVEFIVSTEFQRAVKNQQLDLERIGSLLDEAHSENVALDLESLGYALRQHLEQIMEQFSTNYADLTLLQQLESTVTQVRALPFEVNLWTAQNRCYEMLRALYPRFRERAEEGDENAAAWIKHFASLGERLSIRMQD